MGAACTPGLDELGQEQREVPPERRPSRQSTVITVITLASQTLNLIPLKT